MERLDEKALRRPDFLPGTPVVLADGQTWYLRKPLVWFVPDEGNASGFRHVLELAPGDDYQDLLDRMYAARNAASEGAEGEQAEGRQAVVGTQLKIGCRLLTANYDLAPAQVAGLVRFGYDPEGNPAGWAIFQAVMDVAEGLGPKPSPDGTDASPMPSGG